MESDAVNHKRQIFHDKDLERQFHDQGFFRHQLLGSDEIRELLDLYEQYEDPSIGNGFYSTIQNPNEEKKQFVSERLTEVIGQAMKGMIDDYYPLFSNFLIKHPANKHQVGIHQDWNYVDESHFRSFNVWVSIVPSGAHNGGMRILPRSHAVKMPIRTTPFDSSIYDRYKRKIEKYSIGLELKPGEALIYDSGLIHYSTKNRSREPRIACAAVFVPKESQPKHYFEKEGQIYEYDIDNTFFSKVIPGQSPGDDYIKVSNADKRYDKTSFLELFK